MSHNVSFPSYYYKQINCLLRLTKSSLYFCLETIKPHNDVGPAFFDELPDKREVVLSGRRKHERAQGDAKK